MQSYTDLRSAPTRCITILCHFKEYLPNISLFWKALHIFNHSSLRSQVYFQVRVSSNAFKKLKRIMNVQNFKIKICCIIWFSYPFLTSGRLTQFLMRGVPLVFLCIPRDHQASRNLQTLQIQRSAAVQRLRQHSATLHNSPLHYRHLSHSAISPPAPSSALSTKLKAMFHMGLESTLPPGDRRVNHHSTPSPRSIAEMRGIFARKNHAT